MIAKPCVQPVCVFGQLLRTICAECEGYFFEKVVDRRTVLSRVTVLNGAVDDVPDFVLEGFIVV